MITLLFLASLVAMFALGVVIRFELVKRLFGPTATLTEKDELTYIVGGGLAILLLCSLLSWAYNLAFMIAIIPGLLGLDFGEKVYYGWDRLKQERENEKYRKLERVR